MMANKTKQQKVAILQAQASTANQTWSAAVRQGKKAMVGAALGQRASHHALGAALAACGIKKDAHGNTIRCRSPYCMPCFNDAVGKQRRFVKLSCRC